MLMSNKIFYLHKEACQAVDDMKVKGTVLTVDDAHFRPMFLVVYDSANGWWHVTPCWGKGVPFSYNRDDMVGTMLVWRFRDYSWLEKKGGA